jgi:flagellar basal body rod protein FlgG
MNVSLYQAAAALEANSRWQEVIAENLAGSSTTGFKKQDVSFSAIQAGLMRSASPGTATEHFGLPNSRMAVNFTPGQVRPTGCPTDVVIDGPGFFEVQLANGDFAYTRAGEFTVNTQGQLVTRQGLPVMGESGTIQLNPNNRKPLTVGADGRISQGQESRGKLKLVEFSDPQLLKPIGGSVFMARDPALQPVDVDEPSFRQGFLEGANTTPIVEMASLMTSMRNYEANQRLIQINDQRMSSAIRDLSGVS